MTSIKWRLFRAPRTWPGDPDVTDTLRAKIWYRTINSLWWILRDTINTAVDHDIRAGVAPREIDPADG
jgi:hypothetical protein